MATPWRRFGGFNIKGTPSMAAPKVLADLKVIKNRCDVFVAQEFKWPWYWVTFAKVYPLGSAEKWRSYATAVAGVRHPIECAQLNAWKGTTFRLRGTKLTLLHQGEAGISDDRWLRAVCLEDRDNNSKALQAWFGTTHFVVGGDNPNDPPKRKAMLKHDLDMLEKFLDSLSGTGWPIVFEMDANIHVGTYAYSRLTSIVNSRKGRFYGDKGVEYLFVIPGTSANVEVKNEWTVPDSELNTDHEGRGITFRTVARS